MDISISFALWRRLFVDNKGDGEIVEYAGFEVVETLDIELQKRNLNARPRSKDPYFESAIFLRKRA